MGAFCFPRAARLLKKGDFARLRQSSRRIGSRYFSAEYRSNEGTVARLGQAVSRRVSKLAVQRNRLKRLVRDSFRHQRLQLPGLDILVIPRSAAVSLPGTDLLADLELLWSKLPRPQR